MFPQLSGLKDNLGVLGADHSRGTRRAVASPGVSETKVPSPSVTNPQQPPDVALNPSFVSKWQFFRSQALVSRGIRVCTKEGGFSQVSFVPLPLTEQGLSCRELCSPEQGMGLPVNSSILWMMQVEMVCFCTLSDV